MALQWGVAPANAANFKAWLSDGTTDAISRITGTGPWVRTDGIKIADTRAELTDGTLFTSIGQDEFGALYSNNPWTGTLANGTHSASNCSNWSDSTAGSNGYVGSSMVAAASGWTAMGTIHCDNFLPLYCFED